MAIVWVNGGLVIKLDQEVSAFFSGSKIDLYSNNVTPAATNVIGDFTICSFGGYSQQTLSSWGSAAIVTAGLARVIHALVTFTWDGTGSPGNIYGYIVRSGGGSLLWAERYPSAPFVPTLSIPSFEVIPRMDAQSIP
jgi:hypothetical protein